MRHGVVAFIVGLAGLAPSSPHSREPLRLPPAVAQLVVIDAFVTDGKERSVPSLVAEDFELLEDHRPVRITAFEPPRPASAPTSAGRRPEAATRESSAAQKPDAEVMVIFIDRRLLSPGGRKRAMDQAQALASEHLRLGGRVVVVAQDGPVRPLTELTASPDEVRRDLDRIGQMAIQSSGADDERIVLSPDVRIGGKRPARHAGHPEGRSTGGGRNEREGDDRPAPRCPPFR